MELSAFNHPLGDPVIPTCETGVVGVASMFNHPVKSQLADQARIVSIRTSMTGPGGG